MILKRFLTYFLDYTNQYFSQFNQTKKIIVGITRTILYAEKYYIRESAQSIVPNVTCKRKNDRANKTERTKKMCTFVTLNV